MAEFVKLHFTALVGSVSRAKMAMVMACNPMNALKLDRSGLGLSN